jgi:hypothetical protein
MELNWKERDLILVLREVYDFFIERNYYVIELNYHGSRDGNYIVFYNFFKKSKIYIEYMPSVNIILTKKKIFEKDIVINLKEMNKNVFNKNMTELDSSTIFIEEIKFYMDYIKKNENLI